MKESLKSIVVDVHCGQCGDFSVGADVIADSQRLLDEGCPGSSYECPPELFARLLSESTLATLQSESSGLQSAEQGSSVRRISVDWSCVAACSLHNLKSRAISRWEDDGGYVATAPQSESC